MLSDISLLALRPCQRFPWRDWWAILARLTNSDSSNKGFRGGEITLRAYPDINCLVIARPLPISLTVSPMGMTVTILISSWKSGPLTTEPYLRFFADTQSSIFHLLWFWRTLHSQPLINFVFIKPPLSAKFWCGHFSPLAKFIDFLLGGLEVIGNLVYGEPFIDHWMGVHFWPDYTRARKIYQLASALSGHRGSRLRGLLSAAGLLLPVFCLLTAVLE